MKTKAIFIILTVAFILTLAAPALVVLADGGEFVRLRGSVEIHTRDCDKVKRADPAGILSADLDDGPACFFCLRNRSK